MCSNSPVINKIKRTSVVPKLHLSFHEKSSLLASFISVHQIQSKIRVILLDLPLLLKPQMYFVDSICLLLYSWLAPFESKGQDICFTLLVFSILLLLSLQGHEGRYTIYVHASREKPEHVSPIFVGRDIHSEKVMLLRMKPF